MQLKRETVKAAGGFSLILGKDGAVVSTEIDDSTSAFADLPQVGDRIEAFICDADRDSFAHNCAWVLNAPDRRVTLKVDFRKARETWVPVDVTIRNVRSENLWVGVTLDDAETWKTALAKFRDLIDGSQHGVVVIADKEPVFANEGFARLLGYDSMVDLASAGLVHMSDNIHPEDLPVVRAHIAARVAGDETDSRYEARMKRKDGSYIWVESSGRLASWGGAPVSISWMSDISARKAAEASLVESRREAERANEAKSAFLATMSHEVRTPLNGVLGMAQALGATELSASQHDMVETIEQSGKTLLAIVNDVLDLSKIEAGKMEIAPTPGDLRHSLVRIKKLYAPTAAEKGLELQLSLDPMIPEVLSFDPVRVRQCVSNLVSNAVKFTDTGAVSVRALYTQRPDANSLITIEVSDTGIGLSDEAQQKLFGEFQQADTTTTRRFGGTGLGLAITRKLARMMGGDVVVSSELGRGSVFALTFEAAEPAEAAQASDRGASDGAAAVPQQPVNVASARGRRVLVVDDNATNRKVVEVFLSQLGVEIVQAGDGQAAIDVLSAEPIDLVLLDIHMPVMDGPTTLGHIRQGDEAWRDVPVIALTADAMSGDRERYLAMGMNGYLAKPIDPRELQAVVVTHLSSGTAQSAAAAAG
ncbi:MAG: response regulator [Maricaulaceae bacterium]|jgi:PAS domain S-box-containing protein